MINFGDCESRKARGKGGPDIGREETMAVRMTIGTIALLGVLCAPVSGTWAWEDAKYPDLKGQWGVIGGPMRFDTTRPWGPGQRAPLTPEYEAIFEANVVDQENGGQGLDKTYLCQSPGMPRVTNGYGQIEFVVTPDTTHVLVQHIHDSRRIYTDGRDWPANLNVEPAFSGYSIGRWIDTDRDGRYDMLEVETRGFKGPRTYDTSGIPLHRDNQTIVKERIFIDKADRNVMFDEVSVIDHALTRPWTVLKAYRRSSEPRPFWREVNCSDENDHVMIGEEAYMLGAGGLLMPTKKGQAAPDLRYFKPAAK
jgi:hypothetical protein